ncbi:DUF3618 domain-containing protein [Streptosporangium sp. NPDC048047]|uniref:DUF3618 domain-containing protein n=1 Tax=Streptosporangium sp. NPDC048047 TaxID=3155748 RepID=UPI00341D0E1C
MTETDPGRAGRESEAAGVTGSRREPVGMPVPPDERQSLDIPPKTPYAPVPGASTGGHIGTGPDGDAGPSAAVAGATGGDAAGGRSGAVGTGTAASGVGAAGTGTAGVTASGGTMTDGRAPARNDTRGDRGTVKDTKESVRRDIENSRRQLGDTVEALVQKTDVKARVKQGADRMVTRARAAAPEVVGRVKERAPVRLKDTAGRQPAALAAAAAAALAVLVLRSLRRNRAGTRRVTVRRTAARRRGW